MIFFIDFEVGAEYKDGEGRRVGRPDVFGVRMCLGLPDLRKGRFGRGEILFRGVVRALGGCRTGSQQCRGKEYDDLFH